MSEPTPKPVEPNTILAQDRTRMASFRTQLALDRTTLAWIRTALTMASFGFGTVAFFRSLEHDVPGNETQKLHQRVVVLGVALIVLGMVSTALAGVSHWFTLRRLMRGETPVLRQWPLSITVAMLLSVVCLTGLWALLLR